MGEYGYKAEFKGIEKKKKKPPKSGACALIWLNTSYLDIVNINRLRALLNFMGSGAWSFLVG